MNKFLDNTGLAHFWSKIKAWGNSVFAPIAHTHTSYAVKHSYTTAANAAKNWYRIANANTQQLDTSKPIHAQFILTAYNTSYDAGYYERWFVNAVVFGRQVHIIIFGGSSAPFSQARILYENTTANIDANDRPAIDIYLNYVLANGTTKIEVEEVYNNGGWTFLADGQLAASSVPSGFENVACSVRNNGVERSTYADYVPYLNRQISNVTAAFTLADNYLYRSRTLNCTGTFTITVPSINSGYMWCVIKNKNATSGVITLHPSTTSVLIDGSNADITLQPGEYVCIHSADANNYSLIADGRWKSQKANAVLTGYSKPSSASAIAATDTVPAAIGKLEKALDAKAADSAVVHLAGAETVAGAKTFSSGIVSGGEFVMSSDSGSITLRGGTASDIGGVGFFYGSGHSSRAGYFRFFARSSSTASKLLEGRPDGTLTWGGQAIQTSSDERIKTSLSIVPDAVLDAWEAVGWGQFQYLDAVERKGEGARLHLGLIAQRVKAVFEKRGLDACAYGILCHEVQEAAGDESAVDLWMIRYTEALAMEAACQRRRADRLEARIATIEEKLNS